MMRLPSFRYEAPTTPESVVELLAQAGPAAKVLAGGTDLLPNMKRRHQQPELLVSLHQVEDLKQREVFLEGCSLGAGTTLTELAGDEGLNAGHRALRQAAAQVATPHLRNAATIGGNVCLDTRCTYYDQNEEWRQSIDYCMKAEGTRCWSRRPRPSAWRSPPPTAPRLSSPSTASSSSWDPTRPAASPSPTSTRTTASST
ncbi:MAG: FAD binding domain-containing protein [Acidobacteriota bacterium]